jgi:hypothetical protein
MNKTLSLCACTAQIKHFNERLSSLPAHNTTIAITRHFLVHFYTVLLDVIKLFDPYCYDGDSPRARSERRGHALANM